MTAEPTDLNAVAVIQKIAAVSHAVGFQAGLPAQDIAGMIVSSLAANPEHVTRFLAEGTELLVDRTITPENGCLSWRAEAGHIFTPTQMRQLKGTQQ